MRARTALYGLLVVVAGAAAVLSFSALRDLALLCGFAARLAWLLPVVVDAGAAAGSLVWLGGWAAEPARVFARRLALVLLAASVAANALGHGLAAYGARPVWWVVVAVSAVAPAVLGAVVHLAVLAARPGGPADVAHTEAPTEVGSGPVPAGLPATDEAVAGATSPGDVAPVPGDVAPGVAPAGGARLTVVGAPGQDRAGALIAAGAGRRRLARELGIREHEARALLVAHRGGSGS